MKNRIVVGLGSACNTQKDSASYVLKSINVPDEIIRGSIRVSVCDFTTEKEVKNFIEVLSDIITRIPDDSQFTLVL